MENKEDLNKIKNFYSGASYYFKIENFFFAPQKVSYTTEVRLSWFTILTIKQKINLLLSFDFILRIFLISDFFTGCCLERKPSKIDIQRSGKIPKSQIFYIVLKRHAMKILYLKATLCSCIQTVNKLIVVSLLIKYHF
jgi:hypothetical protein